MAEAGTVVSTLANKGDKAVRDLSLHVLDITTNSVAAGATRIEVWIHLYTQRDQLVIEIADNGRGMSPEFLSRVIDPFSTTRTTRKVGLGLPLLKEACELTGGELLITSTTGVGTKVVATFGLSSIDRLPLGDIGETMASLIASYPQIDFAIYFSQDSLEKKGIDTVEVKAQLGDIPLSEPEVYVFIRDYIREQQEILGGI